MPASRPCAIAALALLLFQALPAADGRALADEVAAACGADAWSAVAQLTFTWHHRPSGRLRSYEWDPVAGTVAVTQGEATTTVPVAGPEDPADEAAVAAHRAFVNDSYWLLFPLHLAWDAGLELDDLGEGPVPGMRILGTTRRLAVRYPAEGGYTPGDTYVLYLDADGLPVAWAYHPGGAEEPKLVTSREGRVALGGLSLPTRFQLPTGEAFITIDAVDVTTTE